jgi:hypothetical protein
MNTAITVLDFQDGKKLAICGAPCSNTQNLAWSQEEEQRLAQEGYQIVGGTQSAQGQNQSQTGGETMQQDRMPQQQQGGQFQANVPQGTPITEENRVGHEQAGTYKSGNGNAQFSQGDNSQQSVNGGGVQGGEQKHVSAGTRQPTNQQG